MGAVVAYHVRDRVDVHELLLRQMELPLERIRVEAEAIERTSGYGRVKASKQGAARRAQLHSWRHREIGAELAAPPVPVHGRGKLGLLVFP